MDSLKFKSGVAQAPECSELIYRVVVMGGGKDMNRNIRFKGGGTGSGLSSAMICRVMRGIWKTARSFVDRVDFWQIKIIPTLVTWYDLAQALSGNRIPMGVQSGD